MKLTTTINAPVLDMFSRDWEFEGKKGTAHFVVFYDYDNHTSERLVVELIKFSIDYLIKPLVNWISSLFPEDWGSTK